MVERVSDKIHRPEPIRPKLPAQPICKYNLLLYKSEVLTRVSFPAMLGSSHQHRREDRFVRPKRKHFEHQRRQLHIFPPQLLWEERERTIEPLLTNQISRVSYWELPRYQQSQNSWNHCAHAQPGYPQNSARARHSAAQNTIKLPRDYTTLRVIFSIYLKNSIPSYPSCHKKKRQVRRERGELKER